MGETFGNVKVDSVTRMVSEELSDMFAKLCLDVKVFPECCIWLILVSSSAALASCKLCYKLSRLDNKM